MARAGQQPVGVIYVSSNPALPGTMDELQKLCSKNAALVKQAVVAGEGGGAGGSAARACSSSSSSSSSGGSDSDSDANAGGIEGGGAGPRKRRRTAHAPPPEELSVTLASVEAAQSALEDFVGVQRIHNAYTQHAPYLLGAAAHRTAPPRPAAAHHSAANVDRDGRNLRNVSRAGGGRGRGRRSWARAPPPGANVDRGAHLPVRRSGQPAYPNRALALELPLPCPLLDPLRWHNLRVTVLGRWQNEDSLRGRSAAAQPALPPQPFGPLRKNSVHPHTHHMYNLILHRFF